MTGRFGWMMLCLAIVASMLYLARADADVRWPTHVNQLNETIQALPDAIEHSDWPRATSLHEQALKQWHTKAKGWTQLNTNQGEVFNFELQLQTVQTAIAEQDAKKSEEELRILLQHWQALLDW